MRNSIALCSPRQSRVEFLERIAYRLFDSQPQLVVNKTNISSFLLVPYTYWQWSWPSELLGIQTTCWFCPLFVFLRHTRLSNIHELCYVANDCCLFALNTEKLERATSPTLEIGLWMEWSLSNICTYSLQFTQAFGRSPSTDHSVGFVVGNKTYWVVCWMSFGKLHSGFFSDGRSPSVTLRELEKGMVFYYLWFERQ